VKILIAYDGSGYSHTSLVDLKHAGLPQKVEVLIVSVAEEWLPPEKNETTFGSPTDNDIVEYFQTRSEQIDRNLAETTAILVEAKRELQRNFPKWSVETEGSIGSPAQEILQRTADFKPDLIVVGAQGLSSDRVSGIGSVSQKILSESHSQVRIVRSNPKTEPAHLKIVICFGGSPCSMEAVKTVAQRSWPGQPEVRLMVATDPLTALIPGRVFRVNSRLPGR